MKDWKLISLRRRASRYSILSLYENRPTSYGADLSDAGSHDVCSWRTSDVPIVGGPGWDFSKAKKSSCMRRNLSEQVVFISVLKWGRFTISCLHEHSQGAILFFSVFHSCMNMQKLHLRALLKSCRALFFFSRQFYSWLKFRYPELYSCRDKFSVPFLFFLFLFFSWREKMFSRCPQNIVTNVTGGTFSSPRRFVI